MVFGFSLYLHLSSVAVKGSHTNPPQPRLWFIPRTESRTHSRESRPGLHISETKHECTCCYIFPFKPALSLLLSQCQLGKINDKRERTRHISPATFSHSCTRRRRRSVSSDVKAQRLPLLVCIFSQNKLLLSDVPQRSIPGVISLLSLPSGPLRRVPTSIISSRQISTLSLQQPPPSILTKPDIKTCSGTHPPALGLLFRRCFRDFLETRSFC